MVDTGERKLAGKTGCICLKIIITLKIIRLLSCGGTKHLSKA